jgi:hypothetical protein
MLDLASVVMLLGLLLAATDLAPAASLALSFVVSD